MVAMALPLAVVLLALLCFSGLDAEQRESPLLRVSSAGPAPPAWALSRGHPGSPKCSLLALGRAGAEREGAVRVRAPDSSLVLLSLRGGWVGVPGETPGPPGGRVGRDEVSVSFTATPGEGGFATALARTSRSPRAAGAEGG